MAKGLLRCSRMRDRKTPRILLVPLYNGYACPVEHCPKRGVRWNGAGVLQHLRNKRHVEDGHHLLYCLTQRGTRGGERSTLDPVRCGRTAELEHSSSSSSAQLPQTQSDDETSCDKQLVLHNKLVNAELPSDFGTPIQQLPECCQQSVLVHAARYVLHCNSQTSCMVYWHCISNIKMYMQAWCHEQ